MFRRLITSALIAAALLLSTASAAEPVDDLRVGVAVGHNSGVEIASLGDVALVTWRATHHYQGKVKAQFVSASGEPVGDAIELPGPLATSSPSVIARDADFVIAWSFDAGNRAAVMLVTVSRHGIVTAVRQHESAVGIRPKLARRANRTLILTALSSRTMQISIVDDHLRAVGPSRILRGAPDDVDVVALENGFYVVGAAASRIYGGAISLEGEPGVLSWLTEQSGAAIVSQVDASAIGDDVVIAWRSVAPGHHKSDILVQSFRNGAAIFEAAVVDDVEFAHTPRLAVSGGRPSVAFLAGAPYRPPFAVFARDVRMADVHMSEPQLIAAGIDADYGIALTAATLLLAGRHPIHDGTSTYELSSPVVTVAHPNGSRHVLTTALREQRQLRAASTAEMTVFAWVELREVSGVPKRVVVARRKGIDGAWMDAEPLPVAESACDQSSPTIASNDTTVMVAWTECHASHPLARTRAISRNGFIGPPNELGVVILAFNEWYDYDTEDVAIAGDEREFVMVWSGRDGKLALRRFGRYGIPLDVAPLMVTTAGIRRRPDVAIANDQIFVASNVEHLFGCRITCDPRTYAVDVAVLDRGDLREVTPTVVSRDFTSSPHIVAAGDGALVFFETYSSPGPQVGVRVVKVASSGIQDSNEGRPIGLSGDINDVEVINGEVLLALRKSGSLRVFAYDSGRLRWQHPAVAGAALAADGEGSPIITFTTTFRDVSRGFYDRLNEERRRRTTGF